MDIELLRTFLEVVRTRHFGKAASELCVTQSAVSARIRQLEQTLARPLFVRHRNNIQLTAEGRQLRNHAETIVQVWSRARQEIGLGTDYTRALAIGAVQDLWHTLLADWLPALRERMPETALQIETGTTDALVRKLLDRVIDLAILFEPPQVPALELRELAVINLVLASTHQGQSPDQALGAGYIMVDWGTSFTLYHARHYPDMPAPALHMNHGNLARQYLQQVHGAAYLPEQMLEPAAPGRPLHRVHTAAVIERPVYGAFATGNDRVDTIRQALGLIPLPGRDRQ
jgi:DNA-binding transcriptional LysR family regulator